MSRTGNYKGKTKADYNAEYSKSKSPEWHKNKNLVKNYGITLEQYNAILQDQNECCAVCGRHASVFVKGLAVDHDHNTGQIRALLCSNCNTGLGNLGDDIEWVSKALQYLKNHQRTAALCETSTFDGDL